MSSDLNTCMTVAVTRFDAFQMVLYMYEFYEEMLERKDIDAIEIATPDHWHALVAIHSCQSGKDVYCQKPLTYTITEALAVQRAVRDNDRVFQVGSQQRSSKEFQKAIAVCLGGGIGHIEKIYAKVGDPPTPLNLPEMPVPANLNFNQWLGPLNDPKVHYNSDLCPVVTLDPEKDEQLWGAWRWYLETGNGFTADWGAHMYWIISMVWMPNIIHTILWQHNIQDILPTTHRLRPRVVRW